MSKSIAIGLNVGVIIFQIVVLAAKVYLHGVSPLLNFMSGFFVACSFGYLLSNTGDGIKEGNRNRTGNPTVLPEGRDFRV